MIRGTLALLGAMLLAEQAVMAQSAALPAADPRPGVTTHFSQGWPTRLNAEAAALGTATIRDSLHWAAIETAPGSYVFTDRNSGHVARACAAGMKVLLGIDPRNRIYDEGFSAHTPAAQLAFARYLGAIAARYRGCVTAIEIGNEINGRGNVTGPGAVNRVDWYMALLRAVRAQLRPAYPEMAVIGGSTNTIAIGFLERLFAAGMLDLVDGIAVHPYRQDPEGLGWELARLDAAMARHGPVRPVWATEFSRDFANPADGAAFYLEMKAQLEASGVARHYWYALIDQKWFPTMGLLTLDGTRKPAGTAYAFAAARLAPLGPAKRIDHGDPALFHYRFGTSFDLVWGAPRDLLASGVRTWRRADGSPSGPVARVSDQPVLIEGAQALDFGRAEVVADSFYDFGQTRLVWIARKEATGIDTPLAPIEGQWTTFLGLPGLRALAVTARGLGPVARTAVVVRHDVSESGPLHLALCLAPQTSTGDGVAASLLHDGRSVWTQRVGSLTGKFEGTVGIDARPGDRIELVVSPGGTASGDRMKYRFRVTRSPPQPTGC